MKNLSSCLIVVWVSHTVGAQSLSPEVVAAAGDQFASSTLLLDWTLGELMTETYEGSPVLTQGFHQPLLQTTSIEELADPLGEIKVYPNPTSDRLFIEKEGAATLQVMVWDLSGRMLLRQSVSGPLGELDLAHLPAGVYVLRLSDGQATAPAIRIEKQ
ncbi:MAG: T9SS type A sorting domain-containing protein [Bacteroidota bacterium]